MCRVASNERLNATWAILLQNIVLKVNVVIWICQLQVQVVEETVVHP